MPNSARPSALRLLSRPRTAGPVAVLVCALAILAARPAQTQTFTVLHNFSNGGDGGSPYAGLTMDRAGNLYGTTCEGGQGNNGVIFKLTQRNGIWQVLNPLYYSFGADRGWCPYGAVTIGPNGDLYGTTWKGGTGGGGTVFKLAPPAHTSSNAIAPWTLTVIHSFAGGGDGANPTSVVLVFDAAGNIYGTTESGGEGCPDYGGCGTVFELAPTAHGQWTETILYKFTDGNDGSLPQAGLILDSAGNLYGTAAGGGIGACGTVFKLARFGSEWIESTLHVFVGVDDGCSPQAGLTLDSADNLYGTTACGGNFTNGSVFELTPQPDGSWTETTLAQLQGGTSACGGPLSGVVIDAAGDLISSRYAFGELGGIGAVFKLIPSGGGWLYTELYDFDYYTGGGSPIGNLLLDSNGNLYGTASVGGQLRGGTIWTITR
jgi:uncharacterized repeat protein (TIGR03803 family)